MTTKTFRPAVLVVTAMATSATAADIVRFEYLISYPQQMLSIDSVPFAATSAVLAARSRFGNPDASIAIIVQAEDTQAAAINQSGAGHLSILQQAGQINEASITQAGNSATALILQFGHNNLATAPKTATTTLPW